MIIFVLGMTGSGTKELGYLLTSHPEIAYDKLNQPQHSMALGTIIHQKPIAPLISFYRSKQYAYKRNYCALEYENIWLVERLRCLNPKFVCISRDPYQTVAAEVLDQTVLNLVQKEHPLNPLSANYSSQLNTIEQLAYRWAINNQRILDLQKTNKGDILFVSYNDLYISPKQTLHQIQHFLELKTPLDFIPTIPQFNKYLTELSPLEIDYIREIINDQDLLRLSR